ncbi:MAG: hypothetical protein BAJALOKI2v1_10085 [Promethearchaeota archaeon]|nr:MAG: hypothetical protein BAJALOKI2v1_10085 [Candidatus Lokiarchaeota archaeon]
MILKEVKINNIRSIKNIKISFPPSSILFFGDIGSGKSSVLKAIEFALFGILSAGDLSGSSLLRRGENKASVELSFYVNGKNFTVKRELKENSSRGTVTQEEGTFIEDGKEYDYSPTELRKKILEILNYSVSRYERAHKIPLFRYTVYTPQEQIKEILRADPEERFEILKDIFGIEKYETILKNVDVLKDYLRNQTNKLETKIEDIGTPEDEIPEIEKSIENKKTELEEQKTELNELNKTLEQKERNLNNLRDEIKEYSKKLVKVENNEELIKELKISIKKNKITIRSLNEDISELKRKVNDLPQIELEIDLSEEKLERLLRKTRELVSEAQQKKAVITSKIGSIDDLLEKGECSLCGQKIHEKERFNHELNSAKTELGKQNSRINTLKSKIEKSENHLERLRKHKKVEKEKESIETLMKEKEKRISELNNLIDEQGDKLKTHENDIKKILEKYSIGNLEKFREHEQNLEDKLDNGIKIKKTLEGEKTTLEKGLSAKETELVHLNEKLKESKKKLEMKSKLHEKHQYVKQLKFWVYDKLPILLRDIERKILASSATQFNEYFNEWFKILVENQNIEIEIKPDNFQPQVYVNGYESPFEDLSGGEKSALSLAYRLALNKIINERHQEVKTSDLLILDEPTDGFSQEQINRMQEIFEKLAIQQMIIISHDRNLDSFVTDIYKFNKQNHQTYVEKEGA